MLEQKILLHTLEIPKYITKVKTANKKNPKYYANSPGRGRVNKLPVRLSKKGSVVVDNKGFYLDENGNKIIANTRTVGKEAFFNINGQILYVGSPWQRAAMKKTLEEFFIPIVETLPVFRGSIIIEAELHCPLSSHLADLDNLGYIYGKVFVDTMVNMGKLIDDKVPYVTKPPTAFFFHPVSSEDDRKFVYHFFQDSRPEILKLQ